MNAINTHLNMKNITLSILGILLQVAILAQSKLELQNFIVKDLKKISGTFLQTYNDKIEQKEYDYQFEIKNCDLIVTSKYTSNGIKIQAAKFIIPINDINEVSLSSKVNYEAGGEKFYTSGRLVIHTSGHTIRKYFDSELTDYDDTYVIGLGTYPLDVATKFKSLFTQYSKYCD